jgi:hypothetical protein
MARINDFAWAALVIAWYGMGVLALATTSYFVLAVLG